MLKRIKSAMVSQSDTGLDSIPGKRSEFCEKCFKFFMNVSTTKICINQ